MVRRLLLLQPPPRGWNACLTCLYRKAVFGFPSCHKAHGDKRALVRMTKTHQFAPPIASFVLTTKHARVRIGSQIAHARWQNDTKGQRADNYAATAGCECPHREQRKVTQRRQSAIAWVSCRHRRWSRASTRNPCSLAGYVRVQLAYPIVRGKTRECFRPLRRRVCHSVRLSCVRVTYSQLYTAT